MRCVPRPVDMKRRKYWGVHTAFQFLNQINNVLRPRFIGQFGPWF